jgi:hypothetical protein
MIVGLIIPITLFAGGIALSRPSALHPRRDNLTYSLNADQQRARWLSDDNRIDDWTRRYLGEHPRNEMDPNFRLGIFREALAADAPLVPLPAPNAQLVEDNQQGGIRSLKLHLTSARNAPTISLTLPGEIELLAVKWDGRPHEIRNTGKLQLPWRLRFEALPSQGVDLELTMRDHTPLTLWLGDLSRGLPLVTGQGHNTRPDYLIPGSGSDVTIVAKKLTF